MLANLPAEANPMTIYEVMDKNPDGAVIVCVVLAIAIAAVAIVALNVLMYCWQLLIRHGNIRSAGWPPPHCDADGDACETSDDGDDPEASGEAQVSYPAKPVPPAAHDRFA